MYTAGVTAEKKSSQKDESSGSNEMPVFKDIWCFP